MRVGPQRTEHWRISAFKLWCWRRLFRVLWTARRSNQSILKEINPEILIGRTDAKAETPILWPTWCEELTHWKRLWCWERLKARGEEGDGGWDGWMASQTQRTWVWINFRSWWWTGQPGTLQSMGVAKSRTQLSDWTTTTKMYFCWHTLSMPIVTKNTLL